MERELLLAVKGDINNRSVINEIELMKRLLPMIESIQVFIQNNDVFDLKKNRKISNQKKIKRLFEDFERNGRYLIISKN